MARIRSVVMVLNSSDLSRDWKLKVNSKCSFSEWVGGLNAFENGLLFFCKFKINLKRRDFDDKYLGHIHRIPL